MPTTILKKLAVYLKPELHLRLKVEAAKRGMSMSELVAQAIVKELR